MIECAFFGVAFTACQAKENRNGGTYAAMLAITDNADEAGSPSSLMVKLIISAELMDEAMTIEKDDRIYVEGAASIGVWHTQKGTKPNVSIRVRHIRKARIGEHREAPEVTQEARNIAAALSRPMPIEELPDLPAFLAG